MMGLMREAALVAATITTGLTAGLFYAFACSVLPGLSRTDDRTFVSAMQSINVAILNGWFALAFAGAPVTITLAALLRLDPAWRRALPWIVAALVLYGVVLFITFAVNVPLNNELGAAWRAGQGDLAAARERFEARWITWNIARAAACTAAFGCLTWALAAYGSRGA